MPTAGRVRDPALDGVRALAVTAVLLFHGGVGWLPGGFLGVDAFFVLSGYLITRLLLREWQATRRIDLTAFCARRARRLLPAFGLLVATVVVVSPLVTVPEDLRPIRGDALAALCYLANWRMILRGTDYFTQEGTPSPLRHTWSLSIEEQFYLLWPLVLLLVLVLAHRAPVGRRLVALRCVCVLGALGSVAVGWLLSASATDPNRLYFGTDTRAVALLTGCALAAFLTDRPAVSARHSRTLAAAALGGTLVVAWLWTHADGTGTALYRGPLLLSALAVAAVLAHAGLVPTSVTARLLAAPQLPALGRISYGVYLWHWPLFEWLDSAATGLTGPALLTARVAVTLLAATVSYWAIERPVLRHAPAAGHSARRTLAVALCSLAVLAGAFVVLPPPPGQVPALADQPARGPALPPLPLPAPTGTTGVLRRSARTPPTVDVFGDSIAWTLMRYLPAHPGLTVHDDTMLGCGVAVGGPYRYFGAMQQPPADCARWPTLLRTDVMAHRPDVVVILVGRWETMNRVHNGQWTHIGQAAFDDYLRGQLGEAIHIGASRGARVVLLTEPYNRRGERPDGGLWPEDQPDRVDRWNRLLRQVAGQHTAEVRVVDLGGHLCPGGHYTDQVDGLRVRSDGVHLTPAGVRWLAPWLLPRITAAAR